MSQIDFKKPMHVHFIGIGGISMSGLAEILLDKGFHVSGSDRVASPVTEHLKEKGAVIYIGQTPENIKPGLDLIVYTAAISPENPEYVAAKASGTLMMTRAVFLGELMRCYALPINVAGTHGKTTTTSMCTHLLLKAGMDPTVTVGGMLPAIGGNIRIGASEVFLAEACEYTNSFLSFFPKISIILNVDADHLDFFKDLDDIAASFHRFAALLPPDGTLIINRDTAKFEEVTRDLNCEIITCSLEEEAGYTARDISFDDRGNGSFTCFEGKEELGRFSLSVPGMHNVSNALAVIALGRKLGIATEVIREALLDFTGTDRRFQKKGTVCGATVIDDYAHHPTEVKATLTAARSYPHKKLYVVFQPHTYTRTKALLSEFAEALKTADHVILADIYAAREVNTLGISSEDLRVEIEKLGTKADYFDSFEKIEDFLKSQLDSGDLLITMGAGNVVDIGEDLVRS